MLLVHDEIKGLGHGIRVMVVVGEVITIPIQPYTTPIQPYTTLYEHIQRYCELIDLFCFYLRDISSVLNSKDKRKGFESHKAPHGYSSMHSMFGIINFISIFKLHRLKYFVTFQLRSSFTFRLYFLA